MARTWPPLEQEWLGRWLLRAGGGWTGRANSALPLGDPGRDVGDAVRTVEAWYERRGLPPLIAVPLPGADALDAVLRDAGWPITHGALVQTAAPAEILRRLPARPDLPAIEVAEDPDDDWLAAYHYRGGALPAHAVAILRGGDARFASIRLRGEVLAIGRFVVASGMAGITAMEVAGARRRGGVGSHVLRGMVEHAGRDGAERVWLQVDPDNTAAQGLYARAGFRTHHRYHYRTRPERTPS